jgi:hypothetical protein
MDLKKIETVVYNPIKSKHGTQYDWWQRPQKRQTFK